MARALMNIRRHLTYPVTSYVLGSAGYRRAGFLRVEALGLRSPASNLSSNSRLIYFVEIVCDK